MKTPWVHSIAISAAFPLLLATLVGPLLTPSVSWAATRIDLREISHVPGELVVKLESVDLAHRFESVALTALSKALGKRAVVAVHAFQTDSTLHVIRLAHDSQLAEAIDILRAQAEVEFVEPNFLFHTFDDGRAVDLRAGVPAGFPNDADFDQLWGLKNTGQVDAEGQLGKAGADIGILPLWHEGFHGSRKIVVGVIDTGIDWDHPDLKANLYTNPAEAGANAGNGKDNDHNGFINDIHGWNFAAHTPDSRDDQKHGSHCAGIIGGVGNNAIGIAGINWEVSLMPVKFLDQFGGGTMEAAVEAINYATLMKVNVTSNSWGGVKFSAILKGAIDKARQAGILFVAAAGNDGRNNDEVPSYPASYDLDNVISVAATDNRDSLAAFSNFGVKRVHVAAPGVKIYSSVKGGGYEALSGTSMAAPHVAGIASLLLSAHPDWDFHELKNRIIQTSDPVRGLKHKVASHGRVNAYSAFHGIVPVTHEPDASLWKSEPYALETEHPYKNNQDLTFTIKRPGAKYIRIHFERFEIETNFDRVLIQNPAGEVSDDLTGSLLPTMSEFVEGDTAVVRLKTDESGPGYGFKIDQIQVIY